MADILNRVPPDALRVFEAAARLQGFTRAAEALGMTQAAVSWRIRDLEERLGHALFVRGARQISLTEDGERLSRAATEAMDILRRAVVDVMQQDSSILSVTVLQSVATQFLAPRLGRFQLANPDLAVRIDSASRLSDLSQDGMDVGIRFGKGHWNGMEARYLFPAIATPMCAPHILQRLGIERPEQLKTVPLIGDSRDWQEWFTSAGLDDAPTASHLRMTADTQVLEMAAALSGEGIALVSPILFARELASGQLVAPFHAASTTQGAYWLCYPANRRNTPKIARFRDWILQQAREDPDIGKATRLAGYEIGQNGPL